MALDNATITTEGKLTIKNITGKDEVAGVLGMKGGLFITGNIKAGELVIDTTQSSSSNGIYAITDVNTDMAIPEGMEKKIIVDVAGDVSVSSAQDALFTEADHLNSIDLTSHEGNIKILAQSRGAVYNNVGTEATGSKNDLSVVAKQGNISIESKDNSSGKNYGGVINKNEGKTTVKAENGSIAITSTSQGVFATDGNIEITSQQNQISAGTNGVVLSGGQVDLKAQASSTGSLLRTTEDDYINVIYGDANGIYIEPNDSGDDAVFNALADQDNYIGGKESGIFVNNDNGSVLLDGVNNYIGFNSEDNVLDKDGKPITDDFIGKNGIYVESGTVTLDADNENRIKATDNGINVNGDEASVSLTGSSNIINVSNVTNGSAYGINAAFGDVLINQENNLAQNTEIHVSADNEAMGIYVAELNEQNNFVETNSDIKVYSDKIFISVTGKNSSLSPSTAGVYAKNNKGNILLNSGDEGIIIDVTASTLNSVPGSVAGIYSENSGNNVFSSSGNINISSSFVDNGNSIGIYSSIAGDKINNNNILLSANNITINSTTGSGSVFGIQTHYADNAESGYTNNVNLTASNNITITTNNTADSGTGNSNAVSVAGGEVVLTAQNGGTIINALCNENNDDIGAYGIYVGSYDSAPFSSFATVTSKLNNNITAGNALYALGGKSTISLLSQTASNILQTNSAGVVAYQDSSIDIIAEQGYNSIDAGGTGIIASDYSDVGNGGTVTLNAKGNQLTSVAYGVRAATNAFVTVTGSTDSNSITVSGAEDAENVYGLYSSASKILLNAEADNLISADDETKGKKTQKGYGNGYAVYTTSGSSVTLEAGNDNQLLGAVYAHGSGTNVFIGGSESEDKAARENRIYSYAYIDGAGDLEREEAFKGKSVISAVYAEEGANIKLSGISNDLRTFAEYQNENQLERVVWAYNGDVKGTSILIDGYASISTNQYDKSPNSLDVAIAAGTGVELTPEKVNQDVAEGDRAKVTVAYTDTTDDQGNTIHSYISGDILSAYEGLVDIRPENNSNARIIINGNLLAGNNGILNVDLGNGGELTGRADDYQDADTGVDNNKATGEEGSYFNPAFSSSILSSGDVNLTMGDSSKWNVTGQSWISSITTDSYGGYSEVVPEIDLTAYNSNDENVTTPEDGGQALTIGSITGDAVFTMNLDGNNVSNGNMLYMKQANGNYYINLTEVVAESEINNGHDGLRFATVGAGSDVTFSVGSRDTGGVFNVEYEVGTDSYALNQENSLYDGTELNNSKPGSETVEAIFGEGTTNRAAKIALLSSEDEGYSQTVDDETTNFKIIAVKDREVSDAGKTIVDMSRANYANAVYMDTLNKRQGEARFVGDTDHGVWVRLRHDNIGKDDSFRSHNTMVEVGFEQRDIVDSGEFHTGFALDYMNGSLDYHTVDGDGDIERYGVWFYTTFLGNDGQYADLVLKYGHLKNDFDFNLSGTGVNVNGDYTNEVASLSAEYGWKFSNSYNYYIEPQAQLQYSYVTGADYTTSYGTKVDLDSIHSLIGRIGFRAGKDFATETPITAYIRGDVLHEFLGDQDIYAYDNTGVMDVTYENDDTWYSAGVGLSVQSSENTYFFIEGEQVFGADNDSTYTVSGGFKHSF